MRKILTSVLVLAMALASFSVVAFAADSDVYFGVDGITAVTATEDTYKVSVYVDPTGVGMEAIDGEYWINVVQLNTSVTNGTNVTTATDIEGMENTDTSNTTILQGVTGDPIAVSDAFMVAELTITRAEGAKTSVVTLDKAFVADYDGVEYQMSGATLTITWPSNDPQPLPEPTEKLPTTFTANGETYNAVNTTVTVADYAGATSGNVIATYWKNGVTELLTKSIPFSTATGTANITGTAGSASFAVAITNVPETVVITAINIAF